MPEASVVREFQQQEFLNELMEKAFDAIGDGDHDSFFLSLSMELAGDLVGQRFTKRAGSIPASMNLRTGDQLIKNHAEYFKGAIGDFSRTPQEAAQLTGRLLLKFLQRGLSEINKAYTHQLVHQQELLYGGRRATAEVPFLGRRER